MKGSRFYNNLRLKRSIWKFIKELDEVPRMQDILLMGGQAVHELEEKLKSYYGCKYALTFSSATNALTAIALSMKLSGKEVITSPYNYGASLGGVLMNGNQLVFTNALADLSMDTADIAHRINTNTAAIWAVDYGGYPHNMQNIRAICDEHQLLYVADASQSLGASIKEKPASSLADVWVTSFGANKTVYAGEGGAIMTNRQDIYEALMCYLHPFRAKIAIGLKAYQECMPINGRIHPIAAIMANERFSHALKKLQKEQVYKTMILKDLKRKQLITSHFLFEDRNSTFFHWLAQPKAPLSTINEYLKEKKGSQKLWAETSQLYSIDEMATQQQDIIQLFRM